MKCPHCKTTIFFGKEIIQSWSLSCWNTLTCPNCKKDFSYSYPKGISKIVLK